LKLKGIISFYIFYTFLGLRAIFANFSLVSESALRCWFYLEIRIVVFIGILLSRKLNSRKPIIIYFSVQVIPSIIFLTLLVLGYLQFKCFSVITLLILIKIGVAPFHSWYMSMSLQLPNFNLIWLLTIQKVIPLQIISMIFCKKTLYYMIIISIMLATRYLLVQVRFKKILIASSILSNNWVLSAMLAENTLLWQKYFISYRGFLVLLFVTLGRGVIEKVPSSNQAIFYIRTWVMILFFFRGFPPSPIFFLKVYIVQSLVDQSLVFLRVSLIISSSIALFSRSNLVLTHQLGSSHQIFYQLDWGRVVLSSIRVTAVRGLIIFTQFFYIR